jgi:transcriptional regulator with XRE-family HTH domain
LSQLELALEADVSARHISFLETGRATPSKEMLLTLANALDVPLRERNLLLLAAGYAPLYGETALDEARMGPVRAVVEILLEANEPRSALAHDRHWDVVMANEAFVRFVAAVTGKAPDLTPLAVTKPPRVNVLRLMFDPDGVRRVVVNWEVTARWLLNEAHRRLAWTRDQKLKDLIAEILRHPGVPARWREPDLESPQVPILPMELDLDGKIARMFSTVTAVSTPHDVTLQELHVEAFYPADAESEATLREYEGRVPALR